MEQTFYIGKSQIGDGAAPLFLPDIDVFFNQDMSVAAATVRILLEAGVDAVKGAVIHRADIALDDESLATYYGGKTGMVEERYRALIERKVIPLTATEDLFRMVRDAGCDFVLSVYDLEGAEFARDIGSAAIKIPSSNITHAPLILGTARLGLPLIIDTGKSTLSEIARALRWAREGGAKRLVIEHSPLPPPAPLGEHHLRMIPTLAAAFDCPVGLSDHHHGEEMLYAAVALGASVLEKGICADDASLDQDVYHAMGVSEVKRVLGKCRAIHEALGAGLRDLADDRPKPVDRMGLVAKRALEPGTRLTLATIDFALPAKGIPVEHWPLVEGWRLRNPIPERGVVRWSDVEAVAS